MWFEGPHAHPVERHPQGVQAPNPHRRPARGAAPPLTGPARRGALPPGRTQGHAHRQDPGGASRLIEAVNKIKGLDINVSKLKEDAEKIQRSFMELAEKNRQVSQQDALGPSKGLYV